MQITIDQTQFDLDGFARASLDYQKRAAGESYGNPIIAESDGTIISDDTPRDVETELSRGNRVFLPFCECGTGKSVDDGTEEGAYDFPCADGKMVRVPGEGPDLPPDDVMKGVLVSLNNAQLTIQSATYGFDDSGSPEEMWDVDEHGVFEAPMKAFVKRFIK